MPGGELPAGVGTVLDHYLQAVDRAVPGRIAGLYIVGSIALGDYRPGQSDLDFVAVTKAPLQPEEIATLAEIHRRRDRQERGPALSGVYLTRDQLQGPAAQAKSVPRWLGRMRVGGHAEANPVL